MKKILISQRLIENNTYFEQREMLDTNWGKLFQEIDILPIILPIHFDTNHYFQELDIDGLILTGGNDLNICQPNKLSQDRDSYEENLINIAIKKDIPILGVCRGMQMLAYYFNSTFKKIDGQIGITHSLKINPKSKYINELEKLKVVNSYHNFTIDTLAEDFIISVKDFDNNIKAIEHKKLKIFAHMWHPERNKPFNKEELNLIKKFFND